MYFNQSYTICLVQTENCRAGNACIESIACKAAVVQPAVGVFNIICSKKETSIYVWICRVCRRS